MKYIVFCCLNDPSFEEEEEREQRKHTTQPLIMYLYLILFEIILDFHTRKVIKKITKNIYVKQKLLPPSEQRWPAPHLQTQ